MDSHFSLAVKSFFSEVAERVSPYTATLQTRVWTGTGGGGTDFYGDGRTASSGSTTTYTAEVNLNPSSRYNVFNGIVEGEQGATAIISAKLEGRSGTTIMQELSRFSGSVMQASHYWTEVLVAGKSARVLQLEHDQLADTISVSLAVPREV